MFILYYEYINSEWKLLNNQNINNENIKIYYLYIIMETKDQLIKTIKE